MFFFLHFQADVNSDNVDDEDEDDTNNSPKETDRLYPTAPLESDDTASVHSTSVWFSYAKKENCTWAFTPRFNSFLKKPICRDVTS